MATQTQTGRPQWPFMSQVVNEAAAISPEAWAALSIWPIRPTQHKTCLTERLSAEHVAACEQRAREGQAAIGVAVHTLLTTYTH